MNNDIIEFIVKSWGWEKWIANSELYCGKLLYVVKDHACSAHYHLKKDETFFCEDGLLDVWYIPPKDWASVYEEGKEPSEYQKWWLNAWDRRLVVATLYSPISHKRLIPGDKLYLPPRTIHQFRAVTDTKLFEFSTQHFDEDSFRIVKGD